MGKRGSEFIFIAFVVVGWIVARYWFHAPEAVVTFFILLMVGWYELDKIIHKLDIITESVESLKGALEELSAKVG